MSDKKKKTPAPPKRRAAGEGEVLPISAIKQDPRNARRHPERNLALLEASFRDHGAARSIVIDEDNRLIAGEGATLGAARAGIKTVRIIEADGDELIAVRRRGLSPAARAALAVLDNRTNETSEWDAEVLRELQDAGLVDLAPMFEAPELDALFGAAAEDGPGPGAGGGRREMNLDGESRYREQYGVIVICGNETEQASIYERLTGEGFNCKVVVT